MNYIIKKFQDFNFDLMYNKAVCLVWLCKNKIIEKKVMKLQKNKLM